MEHSDPETGLQGKEGRTLNTGVQWSKGYSEGIGAERGLTFKKKEVDPCSQTAKAHKSVGRRRRGLKGNQIVKKQTVLTAFGTKLFGYQQGPRSARKSTAS